LDKEVNLEDLSGAHLALELKKQAPEAYQVVLSFLVLSALVIQEVQMLGPGQLAERYDLAHRT